MNIGASKLEINNQIYEKGVNNVKTIFINTDDRTVKIDFEDETEWESKIFFLENTESISYNMQRLAIDPLSGFKKL
jgi:hypothetical protein